ncbi:MAG TPA: hypothetical protein VHT30_00110 [Acidimicrobiales bacterium]|jgi:hypothetical protein|nr:hypothetical protein [Acidimicrobiales bacterium]
MARNKVGSDYILASVQNPAGVDSLRIDQPEDLIVRVHNATSTSYPLSPRDSTNPPPHIRIDLTGTGDRVSLDPGLVTCPGFRVDSWADCHLDLVSVGTYGWWLAGDTLAISLPQLTVHGPPGLGYLGVDLAGFGAAIDGSDKLALVKLAGGTEGAGPRGIDVSWVEGHPLMVARTNADARAATAVMRLAVPTNQLPNALQITPQIFVSLPAPVGVVRPLTSPAHADQINLRSRSRSWTTERIDTTGMPVWRLKPDPEAPPADTAITLDVELDNLVGDLPPGTGHLVVYNVAIPDHPDGYRLLTARLAADSVRIDKFSIDPTSIDNLNAPTEVSLTWETTNATTVTLSGVGIVDPQEDQRRVRVEQTTTFVLTAYDASLFQIAAKDITVTVRPDLATRLVPAGTIVAWNGTDIPANWALCNGDKGTPDLRDRFIVSAGVKQKPRDKGDADSHTHGVPPLSRSFYTNDSGNHTHNLPNGWYARRMLGGIWKDNDSHPSIDTTSDINNETVMQWAATHSHSVEVTLEASQTNANEGAVLPPWYALAFIMKLPVGDS